MKRLNRRGLRRVLAVAVSTAAFFGITTWNQSSSTAQKYLEANVMLAGNITGRVFQDFNGNGTFDAAPTITNDGAGTIGVAIDHGVQNVQVRAYNAAGANVTTGGVVNTDASGNYTLITNDAGAGPYRVEFTSLPAGFRPSPRSTDSVNGGTATNSGSTAQFASTPATNVNLAVNYPTDYSQNNPQVVTALYAEDDQITGPNNSQAVLSSFPYSAGSNYTGTVATNEAAFDLPSINPLDVPANQVGPIFGLAYARRTRLIYAGAFFKRHVGFGPQGPNAVYVVNRTGTGSVSTFFTVPGTATNSHAAPLQIDNSNIGWNAVGTTSLGGMALSEDESTLFVMNLANRTLYALNASTGALITSQAVPTNLPLPSGTCAAADSRPFAVTMYHGQLYVGLVCSAQSSANADTFLPANDTNANGIHDAGDYFVDANNSGVRDAGEPYYELTGNGVYNVGETYTDVDGNGVYNLGDARGLRAYVYTANPTTLAFSAAPVFQMPLNYRRGLGTRTQSAGGAWRPWSNVYRNASTNSTRTIYSQPMLTDIAFDNGNLILGLRDRIGDQVGNGANSNPATEGTLGITYQPRTSGDIIRACGVLNSWTVENNGRCAGSGTAPLSSAEGPGGGEFYYGDSYDLVGDFIFPTTTIAGKGGNHDETGSGAVEQMPGAPDVMITNYDAIPNIANVIHDGGIRWLSNTTGDFTKGYRLFNANGDDADYLGKAGGVGSGMVILSDPAPIELGNRVWRDANGNGIQEPGELPVAGVTVRLYQGSTLVGTAVTDANGEYYFVSGTVVDPNTTDNIGQVNGGILYTTAYQIRFDNPANYTVGGPLVGLFVTTANQTAQLGDDDSSDSDTVSVLNPAGSPAGTFPVISITTGGPGANDHTLDAGFRLSPSAAPVSLEGQVFTASGNGIRNARLVLTERDGTSHEARTGSFGYFKFENIPSGQTVFVTVQTKNFIFLNPTRVISLNENIADLYFIAEN